VKSVEDTAPESISDSKTWLTWNGDYDNPHVSKDDWEADIESEWEQTNGIEDQATPEQRNVSIARNVPRLIWPSRRSKKKSEKWLVTVSTMETRRNKGNKISLDSMGQ
jgi:hypothetical protein